LKGLKRGSATSGWCFLGRLSSFFVPVFLVFVPVFVPTFLFIVPPPYIALSYQGRKLKNGGRKPGRKLKNGGRKPGRKLKKRGTKTLITLFEPIRIFRNQRWAARPGRLRRRSFGFVLGGGCRSKSFLHSSPAGQR
jgi:hypothetical protein